MAACITFFAPPLAMATTQLARAVHYDDIPVRDFGNTVDRNLLRMSWAVVTDGDGNRKLQIEWMRSADHR